jgi:taurine dioxygenase
MRHRKISDVLGAEVLDFDATRPATAEEQQQLRDLFCEHHLLLIRGQDLHEADQDRFTQYFGPLSLMTKDSAAGHVSNRGLVREDDGPVVTGQQRLLWHADGTYGVHPGIGTSLLAMEVAEGTTPTLYASATRPLGMMPAELYDRIKRLKVINFRNVAEETTYQRVRIEDIPQDALSGFRSYEHPVIYRPPHIDEDVLIVNELATSHISDMDRHEGEVLIQELFSYIYADDNVYTHVWQPQDLLIWDNIALQHCRPADFGEGAAPRHLRRLSLDGWILPNGELIDWPAAGTLRDKDEPLRSPEPA